MTEAGESCALSYWSNQMAWQSQQTSRITSPWIWRPKRRLSIGARQLGQARVVGMGVRTGYRRARRRGNPVQYFPPCAAATSSTPTAT